MMERSRQYEKVMLRGCLAIALLGGVARLWGFLSAGPLWLDELFIASNLKQLSFIELLGPLLDDQQAPVGWLWLEKAIWLSCGQDEAMLRLPALLASLVSLPLVWLVARRSVGEKPAYLALLIVATSPFALWQSFQLKPYATDLFFAVLLIWLAQRGLNGDSGLALLAAVGALAVWLSMPAVFVLGGIGSVLLGVALFDSQQSRPDRRRSGLIATAIVSSWALSFSAHYLLFLRPRPQPDWLYSFWSSGFLAWPPARWDVFWLPRVLVHSMGDPVGFVGLAPLAAALLVVGAVLSMRQASASRSLKESLPLGLVAAPILFALIASALRLYPFASRLSLFLLPSLAILFASGISHLRRLWPRGESLIMAGLAVLMTVPLSLSLLWLPRGGLPIAAESRALFEILQQEHDAGDPVVLAHLATYAWRLYGVPVEGEVLEVAPAWLDSDRVTALVETLKSIETPTAWIVLTRVHVEQPRSVGALSSRYDDFIESQTTWPGTRPFRDAIEADWHIELERSVYGGVLWRVERRVVRDSESQAQKTSGGASRWPRPAGSAASYRSAAGR